MAYHRLWEQATEWLQNHGDGGEVTAEKSYVWPMQYLAEGGRKMNFGRGSHDREAFLEAFREKSYNVLLVQLHAGEYGDDEQAARFEKTLDLLAQVAKEQRARLVLVPYSFDFAERGQVGFNRIVEAAKLRDAVVAPWWLALKTVSEERPDIPLRYESNKSHHGQHGTYLDLCATFFALTNMPPEKANLPLTYESMIRFEENGEVDNRMTEVELDPETADYLQNKAWDAWEQVRPATPEDRAN